LALKVEDGLSAEQWAEMGPIVELYGSAALNAELAGVLRAPHRAEAQRRKVSTFLFLILKLICPCELSLLLSL